MKMKVFKYRVPIEDELVLVMPKGAEILHCDEQQGQPFFWALVDLNAPKEERLFVLRGTGHLIDRPSETLVYVGTHHLRSRGLVFHLFEVLDDVEEPSTAALLRQGLYGLGLSGFGRLFDNNDNDEEER